MLNDPIADMLTRVRNAAQQKHRYVDVRLSKQILFMLDVLVGDGFIQQYVVNDEKRLVRIYLKYDKSRNPFIQGLKRISKPGKRIYVKWDEVPIISKGLGMSVVSTSKGIMSGTNARKQHIGGELLCAIW